MAQAFALDDLNSVIDAFERRKDDLTHSLRPVRTKLVTGQAYGAGAPARRC
jgi:hypothetical protein